MGVPVHPFATGVMVIVAVMDDVVALVAVKAGIDVTPVPLAPKPIAVLLLLQLNVTPAGVPVRVLAATATPLHQVWFASAVAVGIGYTVTVTLVVPEHPNAVVPVTEYVVVLVGLTVTGFPVPRLLLQVYVAPPLAVSVEVEPLHMLEGAAVAVMVAEEPTVTVTVVDAVQPPAAVAVTEYVVVVAGVTVMEALVEPVFHA